jgi:hypothetical protein
MTSHFPLPVSIGALAFIALTNGWNSWARSRPLVAAGTVTKAEARRFAVGAAAIAALVVCPVLLALPWAVRSPASNCAVNDAMGRVMTGWVLWTECWLLVLLVWVRLGRGADYLARFSPTFGRGWGWGLRKPSTPQQIRFWVSLLAAFWTISGVGTVASLAYHGPLSRWHHSCAQAPNDAPRE